MRIALYCRVSKDNGSQTTENQELQLEQYANALDGEIVYRYIDRASGSNSKRDAFCQMLKDSDNRKFDLLLVWSIDRFSREGISNTLGYMDRLKRNKVAVKSLQESWMDTSNEGIAELLLAFMAWVAKNERGRMIERINAGLDRVRNQGKALGRPTGSKDKKRRRKSGYHQRWAKKKTRSK